MSALSNYTNYGKFIEARQRSNSVESARWSRCDGCGARISWHDRSPFNNYDHTFINHNYQLNYYNRLQDPKCHQYQATNYCRYCEQRVLRLELADFERPNPVTPIENQPCLTSSRRRTPTTPGTSKMVTFALPPTVNSDNRLFRSQSVDSVESDLRRQRHLPNIPTNKRPLSPTIPIAKLRLYRSAWQNGTVAPQRGTFLSLPNSPSHRAVGQRKWDSYWPTWYSISNQNNKEWPVGSWGNGATIYNQINCYPAEKWSELRRRIPLCRSSPHSFCELEPRIDRSRIPGSNNAFKKDTNICSSPLQNMHRQMSYFVNERKNALRSQSDLNALLTMYSKPPQPINAPPAGVANYQRIPQYMLSGRSGSLGCGLALSYTGYEPALPQYQRHCCCHPQSNTTNGCLSSQRTVDHLTNQFSRLEGFYRPDINQNTERHSQHYCTSNTGY